MIKNTFELISEAAKSEDSEYLDADLDDIESDLDDVYDDIEELDDEEYLNYDEACVPILQQSEDRYLLEMDVLAKYMKSNEIVDFAEAISNLCEYNNIAVEDTYVVVESADSIYELLDEAKRTKNSKKAKALAGSTAEILGLMKTKGIKVVKKKSKKRKRSR